MGGTVAGQSASTDMVTALPKRAPPAATPDALTPRELPMWLAALR
jgi:hypothetical protein